MNFTRKKLPREAAIEMRSFPIHTVKPYELMLAPVYVYMKMNAKFISVKAPLDFFTPEELERLKSLESFFFPQCLDTAAPFKDSATTIRKILTWESASDSKNPPAPYEVSDSVIQVMGRLWRFGEGGSPIIEPFFATVFANELCDPLPSEQLLAARDQDVDLYEYAIFVSSLAVFFALHLGYCDLLFLNQTRAQVFTNALGGKKEKAQNEIEQLALIAANTFESREYRFLSGDTFKNRPERVSQKLSSRLERVKSNLEIDESPVPSIYGPGGFVDV